MEKKDEALVELGRFLRENNYRFVTPTPATHQRVNRRAGNQRGRTLTDIFGWSRTFRKGVLPAPVMALLEEADAFEFTAGELRSAVRFSTLGEQIFVHSAFPTDKPDSVFFGPDTYRFTRCIAHLKTSRTGFAPRSVIDIGCGSGAGGFFARSIFPSITGLILADVNASAVRFSRINAAINEAAGTTMRESDTFENIPERADLVLSNPPYLVDLKERAYRHGGGAWGYELSLRILSRALDHLSDDGVLLLYTGAAIVDGEDLFREAVEALLEHHPFHYEEVDPDVFGEELEQAPYDGADRIAAVCLVVAAADLKRR